MKFKMKLGKIAVIVLIPTFILAPEEGSTVVVVVVVVCSCS